MRDGFGFVFGGCGGCIHVRASSEKQEEQKRAEERFKLIGEANDVLQVCARACVRAGEESRYECIQMFSLCVFSLAGMTVSMGVCPSQEARGR